MRRGGKAWSKFLLTRASTVLFVLLLISSATFFITRHLGNPVYLIVGAQASEEILEAARQEIGLDRPIHEQYLLYLRSVASGNFGVSRFTYNPVIEDIQRRLPATLELATVALLLTTILGVIGGMLAAVSRGGIISKTIDAIASIGVSVDRPWFALMLIYVFYFALGLAPAPVGRIGTGLTGFPQVTGFFLIDTALAGDWVAFVSAARHMLLPVAVLAFTTLPYILNLVRANATAALQSSYIENARAFGLPKVTQYRYILRNMLPSLLTLVAVNYAWLISANIIVEEIFSWPGLGSYTIQAMHNSDYDPVIAVVLLAAIVYTGLYFIVDVLSAMVDPRWTID